ncbi:MAG: hypothetical protein WCV50_04255 [Patescibacteria group bacterium]|jgi:hypothetical protein
MAKDSKGQIENRKAVDANLAKRGIPPIDTLTNPDNILKGIFGDRRKTHELLRDVRGR